MQSSKVPWLRRAAVATAAGALAVGGALLGTAPASAADPVGDLTLAVVIAPTTTLLSPGAPIQYELEATLSGAPSGTFTVMMEKSGPLAAHPRGLTVQVDLCTQTWQGVGSGATCPSGAEHAFTAGPADDYTTGSPEFTLADLTATQPRYILVTLSVEDSPAAMADHSLMGIDAAYDVAFTAAGDGTTGPAVIDLPSGDLPSTGIDPTGLRAALLISGASLLLGLLTMLFRGRLRRGETDR